MYLFLRDRLEHYQIFIYFFAVISAVGIAFLVAGTDVLESWITPSLGLMLFVTFLQVPLADLGRAFTRIRFLAALIISNFLIIPLLVALLVQFLPTTNLMVKLGFLLVLLTPCIDYVVTFSHIGKADSRLLLASTPALLVIQMLLLPVYLRVFFGDSVADLVQFEPFVDAFVWLIVVPLFLAVLVQLWAARSKLGSRVEVGLGLLPVPATALVLFIVVTAVVPQLGAAIEVALLVVPFYVVFAVTAPFIGWVVARVVKLEVSAARAVAFSSATRNSLVVLPLALAVPGAIPVLPAIIVTQTLVELVASIIYMRLIPKLGAT
ncbi:MAG: arsenic resistance protein [Gammaproteobacteria bacterium]|nr:arsenic resistance protein [Gammaproteobacteria bacterium]